MVPVVSLVLPDSAATSRFGHALGRAVQRHLDDVRAHGLPLTVSGELGAGKTALVRAVLRALGVSGPVKSPTFALLEPYSVSSLDFDHFDFYRFADPSEFGSSGFRDHFGHYRKFNKRAARRHFNLPCYRCRSVFFLGSSQRYG